MKLKSVKHAVNFQSMSRCPGAFILPKNSLKLQFLEIDFGDMFSRKHYHIITSFQG